MNNRLKYETSPYLLQHAQNPVDWYPWSDEAFRRAQMEDKPVFLSIGYSTCHWCHVMAHESFEDEEIADILNRHFVSIKVDKEERPDIDSIYMSVCQAFTGSGGWPTTIFMTAEQKPFFAGTYFPKRAGRGMIGLRELLNIIHEKWQSDRESLLKQADDVVKHLSAGTTRGGGTQRDTAEAAAQIYRKTYDRQNGGFGNAPKFPTPHNLLFLMAYYERRGEEDCLAMAEHTLMQMYRGGLFDHIGFGFCRYSTDKRFLVPHFEKMLYDNALLIMAYCKAYTVTGKELYLNIARKTADYILREMTSGHGGFFSAQDADSEGEEGKFYLLTPGDITEVLDQKDAERFCRRFGITSAGNFEGKSIPNLLDSDPEDSSFEPLIDRVREYRRGRYFLHLDDKILTVHSSLMTAAMCRLYQVSGNVRYLNAAKAADRFMQDNMSEGNTLFVSFREGKRGVKGFLDDYAARIFAQLALYSATLERDYIERAQSLCVTCFEQFWDDESGGFYLYGHENDALIFRPKESYDGAIPSGNSLMAWNLVRLAQLTDDEEYKIKAKLQLDFLASEAALYPAGYAMYLLALLEHEEPSAKVTVVQAEGEDINTLPLSCDPDWAVVLCSPTEEYPLKDQKTTYYICRSHSCLPPTNNLNDLKDRR